MYIAVVALTMLVLPLVSIAIDSGFHPGALAVVLVGRWFVFWGVGVRLGLAGMRQLFRPSFTAREIFHTTNDEVLPLVRELGAANLSVAVVDLLSLAMPHFVLPAAIYATIFYSVAGVALQPGRDLCLWVIFGRILSQPQVEISAKIASIDVARAEGQGVAEEARRRLAAEIEALRRPHHTTRGRGLWPSSPSS